MSNSRKWKGELCLIICKECKIKSLPGAHRRYGIDYNAHNT